MLCALPPCAASPGCGRAAAPPRCTRLSRGLPAPKAPCGWAALASRAARRAGRRLRATDGDGDGQPDVFATLQAQLAREMQRRRGLAMFEAELAKADEDVSVTRAALYIAMHVSSEIDTEAYMDRLEAWGRELQAHLPPPDQRYTRRMLLALNAFMFDELGFRGAPNAEWGTVENSCLNHVLDARTGIPLTMSIVYLDLARSAGLPMVGVNLPAHFVVRPVAEGVEALVDVYNAGAIIAVEDAEELLGPLYGQGAKIQIDRSFFNDDTPKPRSILTRMLTNLKQIYFNSKQYDSALLMIEYQAACAPDPGIAAMNQRDRGICLYLSGRYVDAIAELQGYLEVYAAAVDRQAIEAAIEICRAALAARRLDNQLNDDSPPPADGDASS